MIIALTGTPGTGKTTVCDVIRDHSRYKKQYCIIDINKIVLGEKLYTGKDEARDTYEADMDELKERVDLEIHKFPSSIDIILEGHLSHLLPVEAIIVLRAHPLAIRKRLGKRMNYSLAKVRENANAEALDVILVESVELNKNVFEINTTDKNLLSVVKSVISIIDGIKHGKIPEEFFPGKINWIEMVEMD
ncbi:MAG: adenylate kinase family protein [Candidatus Methanoperedens sp.]|nr:adenylate kinase family protein [Candidatus Methanoperedens sp.]